MSFCAQNYLFEHCYLEDGATNLGMTFRCSLIMRSDDSNISGSEQSLDDDFVDVRKSKNKREAPLVKGKSGRSSHNVQRNTQRSMSSVSLFGVCTVFIYFSGCDLCRRSTTGVDG